MNIIKQLATSVVLLAGTWSAAGQEIVEYIHTDALGSPVAVSDAAGNVTERTVYEPYGATVGSGPSDAPGFTGHVADSATGLTYMQQRYMDPELGGFLSVDPVTAYQQPVGQFNRYRYANGNPYTFNDPDGRQVSDPRSCHEANSCVSAKEAQAQIGRDGRLMLKVLGTAASTGATGGAAAEGGSLISSLAGFVRALKAGDDGMPQGASVGGVRAGSSPAETRSALEAAGYAGKKISNKSGTESGTLHNVPSMKMDVRVMDGGPNHAPRVSVTRQGNPRQPVNPENGKNFGNISKGEQRTGSHIYYRDKK